MLGRPAQLKTCSKCLCDKPISRFENKRPGQRRGVCKDCREHDKKVARQKGSRKELVRCYLLHHPCVDCGETNPVVLEFDHRDPSKKSREINSISKNLFEDEVAKCDVRCANCHRIRHAKMGMKPISPLHEICVNGATEYYRASSSGPMTPLPFQRVYSA